MRRYTTVNPREEVGIQQLIHLFLGQSTTDIRCKLQKFKGPDMRNLEKLVDEAWRVYRNREEAYKQNVCKLMSVAIAEKGGGIQGQRNPGGSARLGKDQCAFCRGFGQWKNECPKRRGDKGRGLVASV